MNRSLISGLLLVAAVITISLVVSTNGAGLKCAHGFSLGGICFCYQYWTGIYCNISYGSPCDNYCFNGGNCTSYQGNPTCNCLYGFTGTRCAISPCSSNPCQHNSTCNLDRAARAGFFCKCQPGYYGLYCQTKGCKICNVLPPGFCQNGGSCTQTDKCHVKCACTSNCNGPTCATCTTTTP